MLSATIHYCQSLNILVIWPLLSKSHFLVYEELGKTLAIRGHNLTVISHFAQKHPLPNYMDISLLKNHSGFTGLELLQIDQLMSPRLERYRAAHLVASFAEMSCPNLLTHPNVQSVVSKRIHFDLVITEYFNTNCHFGIIKALKHEGPVIGTI